MNKPKLKILNGAANDILYIMDWRNPLIGGFFLNGNNLNFKVDLMKKKIISKERDAVFEIYLEKISWFTYFLKLNKIPKKSIKSAIIKINSSLEKVKFETIDGRIFENQRIFY